MFFFSLLAGLDVQNIPYDPVVLGLEGGVHLVQPVRLDELHLGHDVVLSTEVHALLQGENGLAQWWLGIGHV